jgi:hypothetical protein
VDITGNLSELESGQPHSIENHRIATKADLKLIVDQPEALVVPEGEEVSSQVCATFPPTKTAYLELLAASTTNVGFVGRLPMD